MSHPLAAELASKETDLYRIKCELSEKFLGIPRHGKRRIRTKLTDAFEKNLVGIGLAEKRTKRSNIGVSSITFFVKRKIKDEARLGELLLPKEIDGVLCDVIPCHYARPANNNWGAYPYLEKLAPGCQIGVDPDYAGTLGGFMRDGRGNRYLLSNCHVLSPYDLMSTGATVLQPASGGLRSRRIGEVSLVFPLWKNGVHDVDLAIARIDDHIEINPDNAFGPVLGTEKIRNRERVQMYGAKTGPSHGWHQAVNTDVGWPINGDNYYFRGFEGFQPAAFADRGDSGTLIASEDDNYWVSMIAGNTGIITCGMPVSAIEAALPDFTWITQIP